MDKGTIISGYDVVSISRKIISSTKRHQAILLSELEEHIGKNHPKFNEIRKLILDSTSDQCRSIINYIFGDIHTG